MDNASFAAQTGVYFKKIRRIALKENVWKFIVFALIISLLISMVVGKKMFSTYEDTRSGLFAITSAAIWVGIFNSIQSICKEHEIIRAEYRQGMKISAYVTAQALWQLIICAVQSMIILGVSIFFINYNSTGVIIGTPIPEYFITLLLITYGADLMGLMVSAIADNATTAMTIMPFVLIIQLIMSGVLFSLSGWSKLVANITFSKWGMSALGASANLNSKKLPLKITQQYKEAAGITRKVNSAYASTTENLLNAWLACLIIAAVFYLITIIVLKLKNRDS